MDYKHLPGPYTWEICDRCNYGHGHTCPGCGEELGHGQWEQHYQEFHANDYQEFHANDYQEFHANDYQEFHAND